MDFETDYISCRLVRTADLDDFHHHDVLVPDKSFFHGEVGVTDRTYTNEGLFFIGIRVQGYQDCLSVVSKGFAIRKEREYVIGICIFGKECERIDNDHLGSAVPDMSDKSREDT